MANEMRDKIAEIIRNAHINANPLAQFGYAEADALIENGVIVPPCKVGETLYLVQIDYEGNYFMTSVIVGSKITILSILRAYEEKTVVYMSTDKEQAEQKLKEVRGGNGNL